VAEVEQNPDQSRVIDHTLLLVVRITFITFAARVLSVLKTSLPCYRLKKWWENNLL